MLHVGGGVGGVGVYKPADWAKTKGGTHTEHQESKAMNLIKIHE